MKISVPDYGSAYLSYNSRRTSPREQAERCPSAPAPPRAACSPSSSTSEFYLGFDVAETVFFRVGNQLLAWGPSFIWTPVDFVNLQKADPLAAFDQRRRQAGRARDGPHGHQQPVPLRGHGRHRDPTGPGGSLVVNDPLDTANLAGGATSRSLGFEFGLTGYLGASIQNKYGFDFSGRLLGFDVYGEAALAFAYDSYDFSYAYSLGFQRTFGELSYWSVSAEFFSNSAGTDDTSATRG